MNFLSPMQADSRLNTRMPFRCRNGYSVETAQITHPSPPSGDGEIYHQDKGEQIREPSMKISDGWMEDYFGRKHVKTAAINQSDSERLIRSKAVPIPSKPAQRQGLVLTP